MSLALEQTDFYTEEDYYNLPEGVRAELIGGRFYDLAAPSRLHQRILGDLYAVIHEHIRSRKGDCEVYPAPFAVRLFEDDKTVVEPAKKQILVYQLSESGVEMDAYTFQDKVQARIHGELWIDFSNLGGGIG